MEIKQNVNLHNRFDIEVIDSKTGKVKQKAEAYNIVLDQMYTRLCDGMSYFVNIHFGTGTGTPLANRTSLFTHLGTKTAVNEEMIKAIPVSSWKRKIVLNPEEFVGSTITEVGIAFGATSTNLVTHAMLKDAEGNPISITKTDTDVINIYATVFVTFGTSSDLVYTAVSSGSNALVNYLIGGAAAPTGNFGLNEISGAYARLGSSATVTWTSDTVNKQRKTNVVRFGTTVGNGNAKVLDFSSTFELLLPATGIFTGQSYTGVPVGTGDGVRTVWTLPSANVRQSAIDIKINGTTTTAYSKATKKTTAIRRADPSINLPTPKNVAISSDGSVMVLSGTTSPYIKTYKYVNSRWTAQPDPTDLPLGISSGCAITPDGTVMAIGYGTTPYINTYDLVGNSWIKRPTPAVPPASAERGCAITPDGLVLAVGEQSSPYINTYDWTGGAWVKRPTPASLPDGQPRGVAISDNGLIMAIAHQTAPCVSTYDWTGGAWVKRPTPATPPVYIGSCVSLSGDGSIMAVGSESTPSINTYDWTGSAWVRRSNPSTMPSGTGITAVRLNQTGTSMIIGNAASPFVYVYDWVGGAWVKQADPASLPSSAILSVGFAKDTDLIVALPNGYAMSYEYNQLTDITFNTPPTTGDVITADYTVDGVHKTDQYVIDVSFAIQFGEGV